jgi:hypothetical protein
MPFAWFRHYAMLLPLLIRRLIYAAIISPIYFASRHAIFFAISAFRRCHMSFRYYCCIFFIATPLYASLITTLLID